jgi:hypothetical protein
MDRDFRLPAQPMQGLLQGGATNDMAAHTTRDAVARMVVAEAEAAEVTASLELMSALC